MEVEHITQLEWRWASTSICALLLQDIQTHTTEMVMSISRSSKCPCKKISPLVHLLAMWTCHYMYTGKENSIQKD